MTQAKNGDKVKVHYTGKLKDGTIFDSSKDREPIQFTLGNGEIIPGFEDAILGMEPGDSVSTDIQSGDAYGAYREEMVTIVKKDQFPGNIDIQVGQRLQIKPKDSQAIVVTVTNVNDEQITLDANHPLAGQDLIFDIELVEIV